MPEIEIRPASSTDIPELVSLDHNYTTDYVWQMEVQQTQDGLVGVQFREVRLPRSVRVEYPRRPQHLMDDWHNRSGLLVAIMQGERVGYIGLSLGLAPLTAWACDLVVKRRVRRQGIGSALVIAACEWGEVHQCRNLILEMQPKNYPAIKMARKLGFEMCGYNDRYYANHDIGLFFAKSLH